MSADLSFSSPQSDEGLVRTLKTKNHIDGRQMVGRHAIESVLLDVGQRTTKDGTKVPDQAEVDRRLDEGVDFFQAQGRLAAAQRADAEPETWTDHLGRTWKEPQIRGRLKMRSAGHAALREFVLHRAGYRCEKCGCDTRDLLVADHILSRRNGGRHHPDNLQCLCGSCNAAKVGLIDRKGTSSP